MRITILAILWIISLACGENKSKADVNTEAKNVSVTKKTESSVVKTSQKDVAEMLTGSIEPMSIEFSNKKVKILSASNTKVSLGTGKTVKDDPKKNAVNVEPITEKENPRHEMKEQPALIKDNPPLEQEKLETAKTVSRLSPKAPETTPTVVDLTTVWDVLLKKYVSKDGAVDYSGFVHAKRELDTYLSLLSTYTPTKDWGRDKTLAYWINVYNAYTIKLIVDNYPVTSIKEIYNGNPWDRKWIGLGDKSYSLNQIENEIIRPTFKEPNIHFAVNCAAKSCPPLWNRAWTANNLNSTLKARAKQFINDDRYNTLGASPKLSRIFEWYAVDFGDVLTFVNIYADEAIPVGAAINYQDYDWRLND